MIRIFGHFNNALPQPFLRLRIRGIRYQIVIVFVFLSHPFSLFASDGWNFITEDDGIALYSRILKGYSSTEFKGICIIDRPIESVGSFLSEVAAYPEWFFRCIQSYKIRAKNSSDLNFLLYVAIDAPWPFSDRHVVYRVVTAVDRVAGDLISIRGTRATTLHSLKNLKKQLS